jgi:type I restriction enzyme S subunit
VNVLAPSASSSEAIPMMASGVEWIGAIPAHWRVLQTRRVCELTTGGRDTQDADQDAAYPFFVRSQTVERIGTHSFDGEGVLTSGDGAGVGKIFHHYIGKLEFHQRVYLYHAFRHVTGRFFFYYLREHLALVVLAGNAKSTVDSLRRPMLQEFPVVVPPIPEQRAIVSFLDRKTAAIDALIAKKERLIELLQEKRQALITQAVTKGLDPNVPMKESGSQAIRRIPSHWTALPIRRFLARIEQGWSPACESSPAESGGWGVLKAGCTANGDYRWTDNKALPATERGRPDIVVREGDLIMSRASGSRHIVGSCAIATRAPARLMLSDKHFRLFPARSVDRRFLALSLGSRAGRSQIELSISGAEGLANNLPQSELRKVVLAIPPLAEQHAITGAVGAETARVDDLISLHRTSVEKLREYRQALITAAVTGKIDVSAEAA